MTDFRLAVLALCLAPAASAQPTDTARGATHTVTVAPGDGLLIRLENEMYSAASDPAPIAIVQPDGAVWDEDVEWEPGVSLRLNAEATRHIPDAAPGTWSVTFLDEETGAREVLTVELIAAPVLPFSLHEAASLGDTAALRAAIDAAGGFVDPRNGRQETPLMTAANAGHLEVARILLAAGADPNAQAGSDGSNYEMTMSLKYPLHYAAGQGHAEIVALLLDAGADPNATDAQDIAGTPLISAIYAAHTDVVRLLLARGADPTAMNEEGESASDLAAQLAEADWTEDADRPARREIAALLAASGR